MLVGFNLTKAEMLIVSCVVNVFVLQIVRWKSRFAWVDGSVGRWECANDGLANSDPVHTMQSDSFLLSIHCMVSTHDLISCVFIWVVSKSAMNGLHMNCAGDLAWSEKMRASNPFPFTSHHQEHLVQAGPSPAYPSFLWHLTSNISLMLALPVSKD